MAQPHEGSISLQHDIQPGPAGAIPTTLDILMKSGYILKDLPECINVPPYNDALLANAGLITTTASQASAPAPKNEETTGSSNTTTTGSISPAASGAHSLSGVPSALCAIVLMGILFIV